MNGDLAVRHLRVLIALADEGTVTDAALALGISQSAASRTLAQLELIVGTRLVDRTTRRLALTDAGQRALAAAHQAVRALDAVTASVAGPGRPLRLGFSWGALGRHTSAVLQDWRRRHPGTPLEVHRIDSRDAGLGRGLVDVAVVRGDLADSTSPAAPRSQWTDPRAQVAEPRSQTLFGEARYLVVPLGHRLAAEPFPALAQVAGETLAITPSVGTTSLELWRPGPGPAGVLPCQNLDEWLTAIAAGQAVGVTTEATAFTHPHPDVAYLPLADADRVPVRLVWPGSVAHPAVAEFVELVREVVGGRALGVNRNQALQDLESER